MVSFTVVLLLVLGNSPLAWNYPTRDKRVVCYMARSGLYLHGNGKFEIQDATAALPLCTHIVYNYVVLDDSTLKIKYIEPYRARRDVPRQLLVSLKNKPQKDYTEGSGGLGGIAETIKFKEEYPHLKIMVGCGGWDDSSLKYSHMTNFTSRRKTFIESAVELLKKHELDGLDLNWQFPGEPCRGGNELDKTNLVLLAKEMREEFDKHGFILSLAVSSFPYRISFGYDLKNLAKHAHFLNVMSYEYHGFWDKKVGAGTGLHPIDPADTMNIESTLDLYEKLEVPPEKINLGLSNYGVTFILESLLDGNETDIIGKPARYSGFKGPYNHKNGFMGYNELCIITRDNSWRVFWDEKTRTKFAVKGRMVISFDDEETYKEKVKYAMKRKLGGVVYYSLERDDFRNDCNHAGKYPLLNNIVNSIYQYADSLKNESIKTVPGKNSEVPLNEELGKREDEEKKDEPKISRNYFVNSYCTFLTVEYDE